MTKKDAKRSNPARNAEIAALRAENARLKGVRDASKRHDTFMVQAQRAGVTAQAQLITKTVDGGEIEWKLQGMRVDGKKVKAEKSAGADNVFRVTNARNRQFDSMFAYLWGMKRGLPAHVLAELAPMAQNWEAVKAAMPETAWTSKVKRDGFEEAVAKAMRQVIWVK